MSLSLRNSEPLLLLPIKIANETDTNRDPYSLSATTGAGMIAALSDSGSAKTNK
jgi:hypothetical protein